MKTFAMRFFLRIAVVDVVVVIVKESQIDEARELNSAWHQNSLMKLCCHSRCRVISDCVRNGLARKKAAIS